MTDQKTKRGGYVLPRNVTQGPPGYSLLRPKKPETKKSVEAAPAVEADPDLQVGGHGLSPEEVVALYANPQFSDEELLLCRSMLFFTADGGNDVLPEVRQLAREALGKIDKALAVRHPEEVAEAPTASPSEPAPVWPQALQDVGFSSETSQAAEPSEPPEPPAAA